MTDRLNQMTDSKLVDVVKNYQRYGYDENTKQKAIEILKTRGFNMEDLQLMGQEKSLTYQSSIAHLKLFSRNSWIAITLYFIALIMSVYFAIEQFDPLLETIVKMSCYMVYLGFMIWSAVNLKNYYELTRKDDYSMDILIYVIGGVPIYILAFFYIRSKMKDELDRI